MKEEKKKENEGNKEEENRGKNGWMYRLIEPFGRCRDNREKFLLDFGKNLSLKRFILRKL